MIFLPPGNIKPTKELKINHLYYLLSNKTLFNPELSLDK
ncbi:Hypothetical protein ABZS17I87_00627 [Kosakonia cowanii]